MGVFYGRWTLAEQTAFQHGLAMYGTNWRAIARLIPTRTLVQIRTHAQKYFMRHDIPAIADLTPLEDVIAADLGEGGEPGEGGGGGGAAAAAAEEAESGGEGADKYSSRSEKRRLIASQLKAQLELIAAGGWEAAPTGGSGVAREGGARSRSSSSSKPGSGGPVKPTPLTVSRVPRAAFDALDPPRPAPPRSHDRSRGMGVSVYPGPGLRGSGSDYDDGGEAAAAEALRLLGEAAALAEREAAAAASDAADLAAAAAARAAAAAAAMVDDADNSGGAHTRAGAAAPAEPPAAAALGAVTYLGAPIPALPMFQVTGPGETVAVAGRPYGWRPLDEEPLHHHHAGAAASATTTTTASFQVVARAAATIRHVALEPLHPIDNLGLLLSCVPVVSAKKQARLGAAPPDAAAASSASAPPAQAVIVDGFAPVATASRDVQRPVAVRMPVESVGYPMPSGLPTPPSLPTSVPLALDVGAQGGAGRDTLQQDPVALPFPVSAATVVPGAAEESDLVRIGDVVLGVSGVCVVGMTVAQVQRTIAAARAVTPGGIVVLHLADVTVESALVEEAALQMASAAAALLGSPALVEDVQDAVLDMHTNADFLLPHMPLSWALDMPRVVGGEVGAGAGGVTVAPLGGVPFHELLSASGRQGRMTLGVGVAPAAAIEVAELQVVNRSGGLASAAGNGSVTSEEVARFDIACKDGIKAQVAVVQRLKALGLAAAGGPGVGGGGSGGGGGAAAAAPATSSATTGAAPSAPALPLGGIVHGSYGASEAGAATPATPYSAAAADAGYSAAAADAPYSAAAAAPSSAAAAAVPYSAGAAAVPYSTDAAAPYSADAAAAPYSAAAAAPPPVADEKPAGSGGAASEGLPPPPPLEVARHMDD